MIGYRDDILHHAYRLAKANRGAPGVDGETFAMIEAAGLNEWLDGIQESLRAKTYRPLPVRRVLIDKPGGGTRPLGIPTDKANCTRGQPDFGMGDNRPSVSSSLRATL